MSDAIQQKIEALLELARAEAADAKSRIADDLSEIMYVDGAPFSPRELDIATDILRGLVRQAEITVRQRMSERLARDPRAPADLVKALAEDDILVARPVLTMSAALRDSDLIEIVRHRTRQHQLLIAGRNNVGEAVSGALAEAGGADVVAELLQNKSAKIADATLSYIAERSKKETELQAPLLKREDLPGEIAARMYGWVASELKTYIEQKYRIAPQILDPSLLDSVEEIAGEHGPEVAWDAKELALADAIKAERLNDPSVLVRLLRGGHVSLFEALFARYINVNLRLARRILYQPDGRALAVACRAVGFERPVFSALLDLAKPPAGERGRPDAGRTDPEGALELFRRISPQESTNVLETWRAREKMNFAR